MAGQANVVACMSLKRKVMNADTGLLEWRRCTGSVTNDHHLVLEMSNDDDDDDRENGNEQRQAGGNDSVGDDNDGDDDCDDQGGGSLGSGQQHTREVVEVALATQLRSISQKRKCKTRCEVVYVSGQGGQEVLVEELMATSPRQCAEWVTLVQDAVQRAVTHTAPSVVLAPPSSPSPSPSPSPPPPPPPSPLPLPLPLPLPSPAARRSSRNKAVATTRSPSITSSSASSFHDGGSPTRGLVVGNLATVVALSPSPKSSPRSTGADATQRRTARTTKAQPVRQQQRTMFSQMLFSSSSAPSSSAKSQTIQPGTTRPSHFLASHSSSRTATNLALSEPHGLPSPTTTSSQFSAPLPADVFAQRLARVRRSQAPSPSPAAEAEAETETPRAVSRTRGPSQSQRQHQYRQYQQRQDETEGDHGGDSGGTSADDEDEEEGRVISPRITPSRSRSRMYPRSQVTASGLTYTSSTTNIRSPRVSTNMEDALSSSSTSSPASSPSRRRHPPPPQHHQHRRHRHHHHQRRRRTPTATSRRAFHPHSSTVTSPPASSLHPTFSDSHASGSLQPSIAAPTRDALRALHAATRGNDELAILQRVEAALRQLEQEKDTARTRERALTNELATLQDAYRLRGAELTHLQAQLTQATRDKQKWKQTAQRTQRRVAQLQDELAIVSDEHKLVAAEAGRVQSQNRDLLAQVHRLDSLVYGRF